MTLIDEFTRECLAIRVARRINGMGVIEAMADAMIVHGVPEHSGLRTIDSPIRIADVPKVVPRMAPRIGEHAREILSELRLSQSDIEPMADSNAIGLPQDV